MEVSGRPQMDFIRGFHDLLVGVRVVRRRSAGASLMRWTRSTAVYCSRDKTYIVCRSIGITPEIRTAAASCYGRHTTSFPTVFPAIFRSRLAPHYCTGLSASRFLDRPKSPSSTTLRKRVGLCLCPVPVAPAVDVGRCSKARRPAGDAWREFVHPGMISVRNGENIRDECPFEVQR